MNKIAPLTRQSMLDLAAVGGYILLIVIAVIVTFSALSDIGEHRASLSAAQAMLAQLEGRAHRSPRDKMSPMADAPVGSPFLAGQSVNVAGAALLQRVVSEIRNIGGNVLSSQVDLDNPGAKQGWVELVVSCEIEPANLQSLLYNVEAEMPFLFIDQLDVRGPQAGIDGGRMRVLMSVSGRWWDQK